ncbi:hypothetical protein [Nocardia nepalensis]|uniref:hypothetical protein n=1 Tax=Nocardia nepalensis TaxID=3375448 RepID=UPI003B67E057
MKGSTQPMDAGVSLDVPDVLVVDEGHLQANWPYLRAAFTVDDPSGEPAGCPAADELINIVGAAGAHP